MCSVVEILTYCSIARSERCDTSVWHIVRCMLSSDTLEYWSLSIFKLFETMAYQRKAVLIKEHSYLTMINEYRKSYDLAREFFLFIGMSDVLKVLKKLHEPWDQNYFVAVSITTSVLQSITYLCIRH